MEFSRSFQLVSNMESVRLICLVLFAILSATTAKHLYEPRIINGQDAQKGQFPHMVSLRGKVRPVHVCGASILSSRFLLTAAHCCQAPHSSPDSMIAYIGAIRLTEGGYSIDLDTITAHKGFNDTFGRFDVAVIRTATEIIFNDLIQPIALPKVDLPEDRSIQVVLSGWGKLKVIETHSLQ